MSTIKEAIISNVLKHPEPSLVDAVHIILRLHRKPLNEIATKAGVSRQMVHSVITGKRNSKKVKQAISKALGFNPWE